VNPQIAGAGRNGFIRAHVNDEWLVLVEYLGELSP